MAYYSKVLNFFPTPKFLKFSYVGVDISPGELRYAEITNNGLSMQLGKWGEKYFPTTSDIFSNEGLKQALCDLKNKEGFEFVKATLPEESTYLFTVDVEDEDEETLRTNIEFHIEENVPIKAADALFEFYVLPVNVTGKKQAVVSVVSRETVAKYTDLFASCGLTVVSFMIESSSLSRVAIPREDSATYLLVNIMDQKTVCAVVSQGYVQFSSTVNTGSNIITEALKKYYKISDIDAEKMKNEKGFLKEEGNEETFMVLMNAISVLKDEIEKVSLYWQTHRDKTLKGSIQKIILAGKDAGLSGFADYLRATIKIEVKLLDAWANVPFYKNHVPPINYKDSLAFGPCLGLSVGSLK